VTGRSGGRAGRNMMSKWTMMKGVGGPAWTVLDKCCMDSVECSDVVHPPGGDFVLKRTLAS
jgi:hypothetical protein